MKRVVVAIEGIGYLNQVNVIFDDLPTIHTEDGDVELILHTSPKYRHGDYGLVPANFDYLILGKQLDSSHHMERSPYVHVVNYLNKINQFSILLRAKALAGEMKLVIPKHSGMIDLEKVLKRDINFVGQQWVSGNYVLKPLSGARGIGQFLVNNNESKVKLEASVLISKLANCKDDLSSILDNPNWNVIYNTHGENSENEGLNALRDQGVFLQEYIDNIEDEYRVLTDGEGELTYIQKRFRREDKFRQAIGSDPSDNSNVCPNVRERISHALGFIAAAAKELDIDPGLMSFDFFTVQGTGDVGILEMSTQYGFEGVPRDLVLNITRDYFTKVIVRLINKLL